MKLYPLTLAVVAAFAAIACDGQTRNNQPTNVGPTASSGAGRPQRYQIFFSPHARADTFLVDTQKGRVWHLVKFVDVPNEPTAFDEIEVIDTSGEVGIKFSEFLRIYGSPETLGQKGKKSKPDSLKQDSAGTPSEQISAKK